MCRHVFKLFILNYTYTTEKNAQNVWRILCLTAVNLSYDVIPAGCAGTVLLIFESFNYQKYTAERFRFCARKSSRSRTLRASLSLCDFNVSRVADGKCGAPGSMYISFNNRYIPSPLSTMHLAAFHCAPQPGRTNPENHRRSPAVESRGMNFQVR